VSALGWLSPAAWLYLARLRLKDADGRPADSAVCLAHAQACPGCRDELARLAAVPPRQALGRAA
jgi:hypothetical protein